MPTKTNFLELEKLEGHENYNGDIENNNLDKIDAAVKNHEERTVVLEDKVHKKDQLSVEFTPEKKVVSVTDSFGGACGFEVEGRLVENLFNKALEKDRNPHKYNNVVVEPGKPYVFKNPTDMQIDMYYGEEGVLSEPAGSVLANGILKLAPTKSKISMYLLNGLGKTFGETMVVQGTDKPMNYFEGLQPTRGVAIEATGRNLFDGNFMDGGVVFNKLSSESFEIVENGLYDESQLNVLPNLKFEPNKQYTFNGFSKEDISTGNLRLAIQYTDGTYENIFVPSEIRTQFNKTSNPSKSIDYISYRFSSSAGNIRTVCDTFMISEGVEIPTTYELHKSSKVVFGDALAKLPNGSMDKIVRENGKTVKYVNTNIGRDGNFYKLKREDVLSVATKSNVVTATISRNSFVDAQLFSNETDNTYIEGLGRIANQSSNLLNTSDIGKYLSSQTSNIILVIFELGSTLEQARDMLENKKVAYQLANSYTVELSDKTEPLNSYDDYAQLSVEDGVIEGKKAAYTLYSNTYYFNSFEHTFLQDSNLKYKVKNINDVFCKGRDITQLCTIEKSVDAYGIQRFYITEAVAEANNIDVDQIYVTYTTSETNGQINAKIIYNADLSGAVSSNASAINIVGEQVDNIAKKMNDVTEYQPTPLGGSIVNAGDPHKVRIVNGYLEGFGALTVTGITSETVILNTGNYKPKEARTFRVSSNLIGTTVDVQVKNNGDWVLGFSGTAPTYVYLDQVRLKVGD